MMLRIRATKIISHIKASVAPGFATIKIGAPAYRRTSFGALKAFCAVYAANTCRPLFPGDLAVGVIPVWKPNVDAGTAANHSYRYKYKK